MRIILQPEEGPQVQLTGDRPEEGIAEGSLTHARLQEAIARIRAESMRFRDRGNKSNALNFSVTREWATPGAAGLYWLTHADSLPGSCTVIFRIEEPGGALTGEVRLPDAVVLAQQGRWEGCSTTFLYTLSGPGFETEN